MKWILGRSEPIAVESGDIEVTEIRKHERPEPGDAVTMLVEGSVVRVLGEEVEVDRLHVTRIIEIRRGPS